VTPPRFSSEPSCATRRAARCGQHARPTGGVGEAVVRHSLPRGDGGGGGRRSRRSTDAWLAAGSGPPSRGGAASRPAASRGWRRMHVATSPQRVEPWITRAGRRGRRTPGTTGSVKGRHGGPRAPACTVYWPHPKNRRQCQRTSIDGALVWVTQVPRRCPTTEVEAIVLYSHYPLTWHPCALCSPRSSNAFSRRTTARRSRFTSDRCHFDRERGCWGS